MRRIMGSAQAAPKLNMPPPPPPPAEVDRPDVAEAEMEILEAPKSSEQKKKYTKKRAGKAQGKSHSKYKGGGLSGIK